MQAVTLNNAVRDLPKLIASTLANDEQTMIVTDNGNVILIDENDWNSINETLLLLKDTRSFTALMEVQEAYKTGKKLPTKSPNEVFNDLQD